MKETDDKFLKIPAEKVQTKSMGNSLPSDVLKVTFVNVKNVDCSCMSLQFYLSVFFPKITRSVGRECMKFGDVSV